MDHILAHEGEPVPDLDAVKEQASSRPSDAMDVDEDDTDALRAAGINVDTAEAKVRGQWCCGDVDRLIRDTEHQVLALWQDLQEHGPRKLPCGEEWS